MLWNTLPQFDISLSSIEPLVSIIGLGGVEYEYTFTCHTDIVQIIMWLPYWLPGDVHVIWGLWLVTGQGARKSKGVVGTCTHRKSLVIITASVHATYWPFMLQNAQNAFLTPQPQPVACRTDIYKPLGGVCGLWGKTINTLVLSLFTFFGINPLIYCLWKSFNLSVWMNFYIIYVIWSLITSQLAI